jgi:hypothetical protein
MKIEIRLNGQFAIHITPETDTERFVLGQILDRSEKGQPVSLARVDEAAVVAVEA